MNATLKLYATVWVTDTVFPYRAWVEAINGDMVTLTPEWRPGMNGFLSKITRPISAIALSAPEATPSFTTGA
jgi:hypothetical protein